MLAVALLLAFVGEPEPEPESTGDYVILAAQPPSAFASPKPRPLELRAGVLLWGRVEATRTRTVVPENDAGNGDVTNGQTTQAVPTRVQARLELRGETLQVLAELQATRDLGDPSAAPRNGFHQLFATHEQQLPRGRLQLRFGRQEYVLGDTHLFGTAPWSANLRSWDGVVVNFSNARGGAELFAGSLARPLMSATQPLVEHVREQVELDAVARGWFDVSTALTLDALIWGRYGIEDDTRNLLTTGVGMRGVAAPGLSYVVDGQLQLGVIERLDLRQRHVAGHVFGTLDYLHPEALGPVRARPGVFVLVDYASGTPCTTTEDVGVAPCTEGTSHDFDSSWMARHRWFGFADRFRAQNVIDSAVGVRVQTEPRSELSLELELTNHLFAFAQPDGRWLDTGGNLIGVALDNRNRWAANEVDVVATLRWRALALDVGWMLVANLAGGRAVSGEALRQFGYVRMIVELWSPWR